MEKLKALLVHRFWLLFGAVLLVPIVGWWIATGSLSSDTVKATEDIKKAVSAVPAGVGLPNASFVEGAQAVVELKQAQYERQQNRLWDQQKPLMTWPIGMESMSRYAFEAKIDDADRLQYQLRYKDEVNRIRRLLPEYNPETETGLVMLEGATLPFVDVKAAWGFSSPSSEQTWEAQMDNWFTEAIFNAIRQVNGTVGNGEGQTIRDVPVRRIGTLVYKGGRRVNAEAAPVAEEGQVEDGLAEGGLAAAATFEPFAGTQGVGVGVGATGANTIGPSPIDVDPVTIFGDPSVVETVEEGAEGPPAARPALGAFGANGQAAAAERRYIDDDEDLPFRTRGFYLRVTVRNDAVPDLLLALSNMDWPTSIVHVHVAEAHPPRLERAGDGGAFRGGGDGFVRPPVRPGLGRPNLGLGGGRPRSEDGENGVGSAGLHTAALGPGNGLAEVVIAGVITVYSEPKKDEEPSTTTETESETGESAETDTPEATDSEEATSADEGTDTEEPTESPEGEPTQEGVDPADPESSGTSGTSDGETPGTNGAVPASDSEESGPEGDGP